jgi:hypothetical protein
MWPNAEKRSVLRHDAKNGIHQPLGCWMKPSATPLHLSDYSELTALSKPLGEFRDLPPDEIALVRIGMKHNAPPDLDETVPVSGASEVSGVS